MFQHSTDCAHRLLDEISRRVPRVYASGTFRTRSPEETLGWTAPFLHRLGITRVANVTGLDRIGVPVVMVCRPNSRSVSVAQGKGLTLAAAKASGVMESIEMYHAEHVTAPLRFAETAEMTRHFKVVDLASLNRITNAIPGGHSPLLWIEAVDLIQRVPVWVPFEFVNLNSSAPLTPGGEFFSVTSNGLASGNQILEAVIHGVTEIVERDATALWWAASKHNKARTRVDPATVGDPDCLEVMSRFEHAETECLIWEITSPVGVAAFMCLLIDQHGGPAESRYTSAGYGCHLNRNVALLRALTEAAQSRLTLIAGSRDDVFRSEYEAVPESSIDALRSLAPPERTARSFLKSPSYDNRFLNEDLDVLLKLLVAAGLEQALAIDLTSEELNIPVVRMVIPGLRGPNPQSRVPQ